MLCRQIFAAWDLQAGEMQMEKGFVQWFTPAVCVESWAMLCGRQEAKWNCTSVPMKCLNNYSNMSGIKTDFVYKPSARHTEMQLFAFVSRMMGLHLASTQKQSYRKSRLWAVNIFMPFFFFSLGNNSLSSFWIKCNGNKTTQWRIQRGRGWEAWRFLRWFGCCFHQVEGVLY